MSEAAGQSDLPSETSGGVEGAHPLVHAIGTLHSQLAHLESLVGTHPGAGRPAPGHQRPAWQRAHQGEHRLPVVIAVLVAIGLQVALPAKLDIKPTWLLPALESAVLIAITAANPIRVTRASRWLRSASVSLIALTSVANAYSSGRLILGLIMGTEGESAGPLLTTGGSIYLTNIIVFALWYWEWDRGGPVARSNGRRPMPDFLFPQMTQDHLAPHNWKPTFLDYLYVSFTNAVAFSPTDTMPLARWAKVLMLVQSSVALITVALVIARAVNILK